MPMFRIGHCAVQFVFQLDATWLYLLAGFMLFKSLMREREVVVDGWLAIIRGGGKHILRL